MYWNFNDSQLQSVASRFCGHYCVFYCIFRSRDIGCVELLVALLATPALTMYSCMALYVCNKSDEKNVYVFLSFFYFSF